MFFLFDIGGTNMRVGISDGQTLKGSKIISRPEGFNQGVETLKESAEELSNGQKIEGISGGIAGVLDMQKTMLAQSSHIGKWVNKPLKQELENIFNCQVLLENDAKIEGLGEAVKGVGVGKRIVAHITLGTGVGGVRIVDGKIDEYTLGFEPGHQIIVPDGNDCNCGGKGHLEAYIAGSYFEKNYGQKGENINDPKIWDEISRYLAIGLVNSTVHWSPEIIILGGSVAKSLPIEKVEGYLKEFLTIFPTPPQLSKATLGEETGLYGALHLLANI